MVHHLLGVDYDVVEVGLGKREFFEEVVHHLLEGRRSIDEAKWHELEIEGSKPGSEGGLLLS